jgi:hypothetical protein
MILKPQHPERAAAARQPMFAFDEIPINWSDPPGRPLVYSR